MTKKQLSTIKSILLEKKKYVLTTLERLQEESQFGQENFNENSAFDIENFEVESQGKEEYFILLSREINYLNLIDKTIKSIENGKYGICKICLKEIPFERLQAVPTANTCVSCKSGQFKNASNIKH